MYASLHFDRILTCFCAVDISRNKYATQSHTAVGTAYSARDAVDRDVTTCMRTDDIGLNSSNKEVWWKVDLGKRYSIHRVSIMFKNYEGKGFFFLKLHKCFVHIF